MVKLDLLVLLQKTNEFIQHQSGLLVRRRQLSGGLLGQLVPGLDCVRFLALGDGGWTPAMHPTSRTLSALSRLARDP